MSFAKNLHVNRMSPLHSLIGAPSLTSTTFDADGEGVQGGFTTFEDVTITDVGFRLTTVTGNPSVRASLLGYTGSEAGSGILGATNNGYVDFNPGAGGLNLAAPDWHWMTLGESVSLSRGDAAFINITTLTADASNSIAVGTGSSGGSAGMMKELLNTTGSYVRQTALPLLAYRCDDGRVFGYPVKTIASVSHNNTSDPRELGIKFRLDAGWGDTYKLASLHWLMVGAHTFGVNLYQGGDAGDHTTVLQSWSGHYSHPPGNNGGAGGRWARVLDPIATLNFGDWYRLTFTVASGSGSMTTHWWEVANDGDMDAFELGQDIMYTYRSAGGDWTDNPKRRPIDWALVMDEWNEPSGGGGGLILPPGMGGGCRG